MLFARILGLLFGKREWRFYLSWVIPAYTARPEAERSPSGQTSEGSKRWTQTEGPTALSLFSIPCLVMTIFLGSSFLPVPSACPSWCNDRKRGGRVPAVTGAHFPIPISEAAGRRGLPAYLPRSDHCGTVTWVSWP